MRVIPFLLLLATVCRPAFAQPAPACPDGRCQRSPVAPVPATSPVRPEWRVATTLTPAQRSLLAAATGYCRLRVTVGSRETLLASAVCIGRPAGSDSALFLTAGHIFADRPQPAGIELQLAGRWTPATLIAADRSPDRALLTAIAPDDLPAPTISRGSGHEGPAVMVGYPGGGAAQAFIGRTSGTSNGLAWMTLDRASHFDCINGASGGGVYAANGMLIGIQSCTDSRGFVSSIGYTPIAAFGPLLTGYASRPQSPVRKPQARNQGCERDPSSTPVRECACDTPSRHISSLKSEVSDLESQIGDLRSRMSHVNQRLDEIERVQQQPFEVQLFDAGNKVGSPRFVRPHGGYLPLDVFGDVDVIHDTDTPADRTKVN